MLKPQGGFARCYEIKDIANGQTYAGKIVSKKLVMKQNQRDKMTQEIKIHQSLKHKNIVGFYNFFEDDCNIYIVLELCPKRVRILFIISIFPPVKQITQNYDAN